MTHNKYNCHGLSATANKMHCSANDAKPTLMALFSPNAGMAMRTKTASEIMVDNPNAAINSPSRWGPRWNCRAAYKMRVETTAWRAV
mmetsp:Transcript_22831/g.48199  ORF Transcript_22831/g.48199 Transcript_22831/m.48199 type:complete len:87 (-) Transcript_22831:1476-1736(-)